MSPLVCHAESVQMCVHMYADTHILYTQKRHIYRLVTMHKQAWTLNTHINQRSAGSWIAASLHQGLNINVQGQISSRGNPFKAILLTGWRFLLIYANLYSQFMLMLCFNLNQCVWSGWKASINLTLSVHLCLCVCLTWLLVSGGNLHIPIYSNCLSHAVSVCIWESGVLVLASPVQEGAAAKRGFLDFNSYSVVIPEMDSS